MTSAYGVGDPSITRRRVEADLAVFREYQMKYTGMLEACKQDMNKSVEDYANFHKMLPQPPELLKIQETSESMCIFAGIIPLILGIWGIFWASPWVTSYVGYVDNGWMYDIETGAKQAIPPGTNIIHGWVKIGHWHGGFFQAGSYPDWAWPWWIVCFIFIACVLFGLVEPIKYLKALKANGDRPRENTRRKRAHEEAMAAAMREAGQKKAADDHRLRVQIRELEGLSKTVGEKAADVRRILATLDNKKG
jgi:hypothetical protein